MHPTDTIAIIGAGISGLAAARLLTESGFSVTVFERERTVGGLIRCQQLPEGLYHRIGGHVFNTKSPEVDAWFWKHFDKDREFSFLSRNAQILIGEQYISYPIENHLYQLPKPIAAAVISEILDLATNRNSQHPHTNLGDYFTRTFGNVLNDLYFEPYNHKIWQRSLLTIPLGWLEGKLPMPTPNEIISSNILRTSETSMVHSKFYYPKSGGSQFVAERLATGLNIKTSSGETEFTRDKNGKWKINSELFDAIIYTGDVRSLEAAYRGFSFGVHADIVKLKTRGISNAFCTCDATDTSWLYVPDLSFCCNRIIYTGSFSQNNNSDRMTCVVEFPYGASAQAVRADLERLPGNLSLIATNDAPDAYVIQEPSTRNDIGNLKKALASDRLYLLGRFAEWEYYNVDAAIAAAMRLSEEILMTHAARR